MFNLQSIYKKILLLYPQQYRRQYGAQIVQTIEDMLVNEPRRLQRVYIWTKEIMVLPGNIFEQHMADIAHKGGLTSSALMGLISLVLLAPFFAAMMLDEVSERLYNQHLYGTWFWSKPILTIWVIALPLISLFISLVTYLVLTLRASIRAGRISLQARRLWPLIATALISSGVLFVVAFHDSAGCWLGGATNLNEAVQCTERVFLNSDKT